MQTIITTTLYLLTAVIPLILSPFSFELFEFPKFIILLSGGLVIITAWIAHIFTTRDYTLLRGETPKYLKLIHWSVICILASQTLTTIFSIHPYTSFWGYYTRFHQGLLSTLLYTVVYFAAVKWLDKKSTLKLIKISVTTSILISLYAIMERLGIDKTFWIQDVQNRVFSTLGQPNWLAAYLLPNIFLLLYLIGIDNRKKISVWSLLSFLILILALIFTKSRSGLLAFALAFIAYALLLTRQYSFKTIKKSLLMYTFIFLTPLLIFGSPLTTQLSQLFNQSAAAKPVTTPSGTVLETGGTESGSIRKIVWEGALALLKKHPLLGTGPETFAYTYYWERPATHNLTSEWDFLYNKAHNEYLNSAATTGLLGLLAYLAFHFAVFSHSLKIVPVTKKINHDDDDRLRNYFPVLGATIIAFATTNFFGFSVVPVYFMMMIIAALPASLNLEPSKDLYPIPYTFYAILPILLIYPTMIVYADYLFNKGKANLEAGKLNIALPLLEKATQYRPSLDLFHNSLGEAYGQASQTASGSDDVATAATAQKYLDLALKQVDITAKLNKYHLNDLKSRTKIYLLIATVDPKYTLAAAQELEKARQLAPTEPKLAYNLGLVYTRLNYLDKAESEFLRAINLKSNYQDPYYALALLYEQSKQEKKLPDLMKLAKSNLATYSAQLKAKIEKY